MPKPDPQASQDLAPSGRLRAALNFGNQVLAVRSPTGEPQGVSVDLARAIADASGLPLDFVQFDSAGKVFDALAQGRWDLAFMAIDPVRGAQMDFTAPYVLIEGTYLVRSDAPFQKTGDVDVEGVHIAVTRGSAYELFLTRHLKHATLVRVERPEDALKTFLDKGLDALAAVRQPLNGFAASHPGLRVLTDAFMRIEQAVGVPKGHDAAHRWLSQFVTEAKSSGWVAEALKRNGQGEANVAP
jgi:polar amino acid transport system substrate-binding protein